GGPRLLMPTGLGSVPPLRRLRARGAGGPRLLVPIGLGSVPPLRRLRARGAGGPRLLMPTGLGSVPPLRRLRARGAGGPRLLMRKAHRIRIRQHLDETPGTDLLLHPLPPFGLEQLGVIADEALAIAGIGEQERRELLGKDVVGADRVPDVVG